MLTKDFFNRDVVSSDGHKLGKIVNLLIDIHTGDVDLVIFPTLVTKLVRDHAGNISGQITGAAISTLKRFIPELEMADMIVDQAGGYAGMRASGKVKTLVNVIQESHYLVPAYFVSRIDDNEITLSITNENCRKWCLNMRSMPESQASFYDESHYSGPKRPVSITLGTFSIENATCVDCVGNRGMVRDIEIDSKSHGAQGIIVNDLRNGTNKRLGIGSLASYSDHLTTSTKFDDCPNSS